MKIILMCCSETNMCIKHKHVNHKSSTKPLLYAKIYVLFQLFFKVYSKLVFIILKYFPKFKGMKLHYMNVILYTTFIIEILIWVNKVSL